MKGYVVVFSLILLVASQLVYSRSIRDDLSLSDGGDHPGSSRSFVAATTVTCEPPYGFLPCSTSVWGLLFLIVVYEILLSIGGQYVASGSDLFFQIIGPGVVGGSVFQFLGTIVQLIVMLVPLLTGSEADAQARVTTGMAMVLGRVAMLLTLVWGLSIILGSYHLSEDDYSKSKETKTHEGSGVVTDVETSWTARLVLIASIPFLILEFQYIFSSETGKRVVILIAFIVTVALLCAYILYQSFQPWIQNRCFEHMIDKYAKDKLLKLIALNGRPSTRKIQELFKKIDKDNNGSVTAKEVRVLVLGVNMDDDEIETTLDLDSIMAYFDLSGDGGITQDEFVKGMAGLASHLLEQTTQAQKTIGGSNNYEVANEDQQPLLASPTSTSTNTSQKSKNSLSIYLRASFFLILGITIASALAQPLVNTVISFAEAANMSNFWVSYMVLPLALNYNTLVRSISSAIQKAPKTNSLTLSSLYGGVFMNNMVGLMPYLVPLYFRNLSSSSNVSGEVLVVLVICVVMGLFTSFKTTFPRWSGYLVLSFYPISLLVVYLLTSVLGWS